MFNNGLATIVMYHYVRELEGARYSSIKGLCLTEFKYQLEYFKKFYTFISIQDVINRIYHDIKIPTNALLLTFDDGYMDHFVNVFPILKKKGIQGCFFPPANAVLYHKVLNVNKIHYLLASVDTPNILHDLYNCLDKYRSDFSLESNDYYYSKLAKANRFDSNEIIFIKRLLQVELEEEIRNKIVDELFHKFVTNDEAAFARKLYMSIDQIKYMARNGMYIGSHGFNHDWLNKLSPAKQITEIDLSLQFLNEVDSPTDNWVMCYPYGGFNSSLISIIKNRDCKLALTANVGVAILNKNNAFTLERLDTNDFPKVGGSTPNAWTEKVLKKN
jgi:peptidoglycan/xylan/chitin deacetylase (PgdA/CDA1 family)